MYKNTLRNTAVTTAVTFSWTKLAVNFDNEGPNTFSVVSANPNDGDEHHFPSR